ncbi:hypothetical protein AMTRI_Chr07g78760 [Amborella trichopoda]
MKKVKPLLDLRGANERLALWKADLCEEGSFDEAINGCHGVSHVATPVDFSPKDPENEVIKPAVKGTLDILRACVKAKSVRRVIFTSSVAPVIAQDHQLSEYDESSWTDVEFCRSSKMWRWSNIRLAEENKLEVVTIAPSIIGPFIMQNMPGSVCLSTDHKYMIVILCLIYIIGNEAYYFVLMQHGPVHVDDLCNAHIFLYEHPAAKGRYICSSHDKTILQLAKMMRERYPEYDIPIEFKDCIETLKPLQLSSKKLTNLGFKFKYKVEDMFDQAIMLCREKGFIPLTTMPTQV